MPVSSDYLAYVTDQLSAIRHLTARRMFGGVGLYAEDLFFALIDDDTLYFKVDDSNRPDYVARGCEAFRPLAKDPNAYSMNYFQVPPEILEDADELVRWARKAIDIAAAQKLKKVTAKKRTPRESTAQRTRSRSR